jgi:hypothetical protein
MKARCSSHVKKKLPWKDNWGTLNDDFKLIYDYMDRIGHNEEYWLMSPHDRTTLHLLCEFSFKMYDMLKELGSKLIY